MQAPICSSACSIAARNSRCQKVVQLNLIRSFTNDRRNNRRCNIQLERAQSTSARQLVPPSSPIGSSKSQRICRRNFEQLRFLSTSRSLRNDRHSPSSFIPVPYVSGMEGGVHHTTDLFSRLLKERVVCCYGTVEDRMAATITASLLYLESESDQPISMYLNSPGGSVSAGLSIYDTMQYVTAPITTIVLGQAASMGSLLACAGSPGKRYILPHATVMLHQPSGGYSGQSSDLAIHAKEILRIRDQLNKIYHRHLNAKSVVERRGKEISLEEIEKMLDRDYFLSPEEAVKLGIVDEILPSRKKADESEKKI